MEEEYKSCTAQHGPCKSKYPRDKVPKRMFLQNPNDPNSKECKSCSDCRNYFNKIEKAKKEEKLKTAKEPEEGFKKCGGDHPSSGSGYPVDKVPRVLFLKNETDPNSKEHKTCRYCREYRKKIHGRTLARRVVKKLLEAPDENFGECSLESHCGTRSIYPKDKVPKHLFLDDPDDPNSQIRKSCYDCRVYMRTQVQQSDDPRFGSCLPSHSNETCPYPRDKIPLYLFLENPNDPKSKLHKTCLFCRQRHRDYFKVHKEKIASLYKENLQLIKDGSNDITCLSGFHEASGSLFPRNQVPILNFQKHPEDPDTEYYTACCDCREHRGKLEKQRLEIKMAEAKEKNLFFCKMCEKEFPFSEQGKNLDGSGSAFCSNCKEHDTEKRERYKREYNKVKYDSFEKSNCSCVRCKKVFLSPPEDTLSVKGIKTYEKPEDKENRYLRYEGREYNVKDFLKKYEQLLEYSVIHYDHMTEEELRESGRLKDDEIFVGKSKEVSKIRSKYGRKKELNICQNLCIKCHLEVTIEREEGKHKVWGLEKQKKEYVNAIKQKGCSCCGYKNENLLRFFDMDHLNPLDKIDIISRMVQDGSITFEQLKEECEKCRVLCKHCHAVNTRRQHENKVFYRKKDEIELGPEVLADSETKFVPKKFILVINKK